MNLSEYNFNDETILFLRNIERDYGKEIEIISKDLGIGNHGFSNIQNGIPTIEINSDYLGNLEGLIVHEAYHLRLRLDGCPDISFESSPDVALTQQNKDYLIWFYHKTWDKITHHYFYPKILAELKLNPYIDFKHELRIYLEKGQILGLNDATKDITLGCYFLQTWVETQNIALLSEFETFLKEKYQGFGIQLGKVLIQLFEQHPLKSIDDFGPLFIKVFNACHLGHAKMKHKSNNSQNMGNYCQKHSIFTMWKA